MTTKFTIYYMSFIAFLPILMLNHWVRTRRTQTIARQGPDVRAKEIHIRILIIIGAVWAAASLIILWVNYRFHESGKRSHEQSQERELKRASG